MKKQYKILLFAGIVIAMIAATAFLVIPKNENMTKEQTSNVLVGVPDADTEELQTSKSEAYRKAMGQKNNYDDYFDSLTEDDSSDEDFSLVNDKDSAGSRSDVHPSNSGDRIKDVLGIEDKQEPETPPAEPKKKPASGGGGSGRSTTKKSSSASSDQKFVQDMDRARAIAEAMGMTDGSQSSAAGSSASQSEEKISIPSSGSTKSSGGIISSLDDWGTDGSDAFGEDETMPVKCMFMKDEKVKNGQRVTIRTLQDFMVDGHLIPANSHLTAVCNISNRLTMNIASVELGGHIIPLNYDAYDFDGSKGIYCPESGTSKNSRLAANQAVSQGSSLIGGYVGTIASAVVRTGASLYQNSSGESYVYLTNGYEFFIMKHKQ